MRYCFQTAAVLLALCITSFSVAEDEPKWPPEQVQKAVDDVMKATGAQALPSVHAVADKYGEEAIPPFGKILKDDDQPLGNRGRAASGLERIGSVKAVPALIVGSRSEIVGLRHQCVRALGMCGRGSREARDRLNEVRKTDMATTINPSTGAKVFYIRGIAAVALARLAERDPKDDYAFIEELPWAATLEDALPIAKKQGKLTVVFITPFDSALFETGYREAAEFVKTQSRPGREVPAHDVGFIKDRALLVGLLADDRTAEFIRQRCVPVRMRLSVLHWSKVYANEPNALKAIGMDDIDVGAPAVLVISPKGKVVAHARNLSSFAPEIFRAIIGNAMSKCRLDSPEALTTAEADFKKDPVPASYAVLLHALLDASEFKRLKKVTASPPEGCADIAQIALAERDLLLGQPQTALAILDAVRPAKRDKPRHAALRAEALLRLGEFKKAAAIKNFKPLNMRVEFFTALGQDRLGESEEARSRLWEMAQGDESDPWVVRASLYSSGGGNPDEWCPFGVLDIPKVLNSTEIGINDPKRKTDIAGAIERAVLYLLQRQRPDGCWEGPLAGTLNDSGQSQNDHSFVARNALVVCALHQALETVDKQYHKRIKKAIEAGSKYVQTWNENPSSLIFGVTYGLQMELDLYDGRKSNAKKRARVRVRKLIAKLREIEHDGGWTYVPNPKRLHTFNTASIMLNLVRVRDLKLDKVDDLLERGAKFLESLRVGKLAVFHYGSMMTHLTNEGERKMSSSMRGPLCELALLKGGFSKNKKQLREGLDLFFEHLDAVRSTVKRWEKFFSPDVWHDAYHYYYGAWYASQAIAEIKDRKAAKKLAKKLLATEEIDGGYCDAQIACGRNSGTAMALMALINCE
ncbi:MAG: hypothetical protein L3J82_02815 [Planctomycetes bacterium]|nr:hypothetical protein [Planctomycetota bacterium]